jgi:uncharacterized RDD family membrane protein YckC
MTATVQSLPSLSRSTPLDTLRLNETPEGIDLGLCVAGPAPRAAALAIDTLIRLALFVAMAPLLALSGMGVGLVLIGVFALMWLYPVVFEVVKGATPGKAAMGLLVVHDDGTPVGLTASLIRNLLRALDFLPLFYGVGLVSTLADPDFRRLGDLAAGTLVIHAPGTQRREGRQRVGAGSASEFPPEAPPLGLDLPTQQAILAFAERAPRLSAARREELALHLVRGLECDGAVTGESAVARLLGWAAWLARGY